MVKNTIKKNSSNLNDSSLIGRNESNIHYQGCSRESLDFNKTSDQIKKELKLESLQPVKIKTKGWLPNGVVAPKIKRGKPSMNKLNYYRLSPKQ